MTTYKFHYRKGLFWKSIKAAGHNFVGELDRMDIYHQDGSITSLSAWSKYDLYLGTDWVLATKQKMEKESGQDIKLNVETKS